MVVVFRKTLCVVPALVLAFSVASQASDWAISSNSIAALNGSLSSVVPVVNTPYNAADYLQSYSALGYAGPLGPYGPLSRFGPLGDNSWSPAYWISEAGDWAIWANDIVDLDGPLSEQGPLGPDGSLGSRGYDIELPAINDFSKQLQAAGVWTALGVVGPLGALGPLGPLGAVGAHGYEQDSQGRYVDDGVEIRRVTIDYEETERSYELYENYTESYAASKTDNDSSFMVEGSVVWPFTEVDSYSFTSTVDQYVTVVVAPVYGLDNFDIQITDANDQLIASANTGDYIDFIQLNNVAAGTELRVRVRVILAASYHTAAKDYRLFVTGSTAYVTTADAISGNHQQRR